MPIRVIVNGASGKMGSLACQVIEAHHEFELTASLSRKDNLRAAISDTQAQVVVDLTRADCVFENSLTILAGGARPVIGTSGLQEQQINHLTELCEKKKLGGIIVPNFSISAVLMMHFPAIAANYLQEVEIIEAHHPQKFDSPSGTALKTAEMIQAARTHLPTEQKHNESITGARGANYQGINIHSLRITGVLAQQQVIFGNTGETLTIAHNTLDRSSFMPGLILCCREVMQLNSLYYGLEKLLNI